MGDMLGYGFWMFVVPVIVGVGLALLSLLLSLIGGAIWKTAPPQRIGRIAGWIMAAPIIFYYCSVLYIELTRTRGETYPTGLVATNFATAGMALIVMTATCVFLAKKLAVAAMQNRVKL
jgi:hypothetical protein